MDQPTIMGKPVSWERAAREIRRETPLGRSDAMRAILESVEHGVVLYDAQRERLVEMASGIDAAVDDGRTEGWGIPEHGLREIAATLRGLAERDELQEALDRARPW